MKSLFVCSEAHPLIKTGGLADVAGSLPRALARLRDKQQQPVVDQRILLPAYPEVIRKLKDVRTLARVPVEGVDGDIRLLESTFPDTNIPLWLVDAPQYFDRVGGPYSDAKGQEWPDNAERFASFCRVAVGIALGKLGLPWRPDIVHCHDWHTGLIPALLSTHSQGPATLFTIHNLAYQGVFSDEMFTKLKLPAELRSVDGLEFHGNLAFIKGGLYYADWLNAVSPTYAEEIQTAEFGFGLEDLLKDRCDHLSGIINGVDYQDWDPQNDPFIKKSFSVDHFKDKLANKTALQKELGLPTSKRTPVLAFIGRLVWQKGLDVFIEAMPELLEQNLQCVVLGSGETHHEHALRGLARQYPEQLAIHIGYDEGLAHRIEAGADMFCMMSRYEPCGLNQIYSQRYGTVPIVRRTGGLADTVVDLSAGGRATGILFEHTSAESLLAAVKRALVVYADPEKWQSLARRGMRRDFGWKRSARQYLDLYNKVCTSSTR